MTRLTAVILAHVVAELRPVFLGRRLRDVAFVPPADLLLFFERAGGVHEWSSLLLSIHPSHARACPATRRYSREEFEKNPFVDGARSLLSGATLEVWRARTADRACDLGFRREGGGGGNLHVELYGPHGNAFLCGPDDRIVATLFPHRKRARSLLRGSTYAAAPPPAAIPSSGVPPEIVNSESHAYTRLVLESLAEPAERERVDGLRQRLQRVLSSARESFAARERDLLGRIDEARDAERVRRTGDLLKSSLHLVRAGLSKVSVPDYYGDPSQLVEIDLDPRLTPVKNAERYYLRSRKLERSVPVLGEEIEWVRSRLADIDRALEQLDGSTEPSEILELERAARQRGILRTPRPAAVKRAEPKEATPYRTFFSRDGLPIRVGRSARDNDRLTFGHSRGNDLWLHAKDHHGSHVVVPLGKRAEAPEQTLLDAACLALHFSAAHSSAGEVQYTKVKNLRRMKNAPPGAVSVSSARTVRLGPDPERLARLLRSRREREEFA